MLTSEILQNRIKNFWGYGNLESPIWLVGMEEGFHVTPNTIADRKMLERQFSLPTADGIFDASRPIDPSICDLTNLSPFLPNANIQKTWKFPITLYLFLKNKREPSENEILCFQHCVLADCKKIEEKDRVATLELSPLPCPNTTDPNAWQRLYDKFMPRKEYEKRYFPERTKQLENLIQKHSSTLKLVIFYSANKKTHLPIWAKAIGKIPERVTHQMYFIKTEKTSFCVIPQPRYLPRAYERLYEFAEKIKERVDPLSR